MLKFKGDTIEIDLDKFLSNTQITIEDLLKRIRGYARTKANSCEELKKLMGNSGGLKLHLVNLDNIQDVSTKMTTFSERKLLESKVDFFLDYENEVNTLFTKEELFKFVNKKLLKNKSLKINQDEFNSIWQKVNVSTNLNTQLSVLNLQIKLFKRRKGVY